MKAPTTLINGLFAVACASAALFGCSSSSTPATVSPTTDSGTDTGTVKTDTGVKADTGTASDTGSGNTCPTDLPSTYACPATPTLPAGSTACTAADAQALFDACWGASADSTTCSAFKSSNAACDTCLGNWTRADGWLQTAGCYLAVDATRTDCAKSDECDDDCTNVVCYNDCSDSTTLSSCLQTAQGAGGTCDNAVKYSTLDSCQKDAKFAGCQVPNDADIVRFYTNACHDNAVFKAAATTDGGVSDAASGG